MIKHSRSHVAAAALAAVTLLACGKARQERTGERAGLRLELLDATVNANRQVEVRYRVSDQTGKERSLSGITNNWTLASLSKDAIGVPMYVAYVRTGQQMPNGERQPGAESENERTGSADLGGGTFRYVFKQQLPEGYDPAATYRVGVYSRLQTGTTSTGAAEYDPQQPNAVLDFVPAGGGTPQSWDLVADDSCNTCHGEVRAHGGFRRGVKICMTCHTTQLYDPDTSDPAKLELGDPAAVLSTVSDGSGTVLPANPLDLGRLIHRIHRGRNLQTVQNVLNAARGCPDPTVGTGCPTPPPALADRQAAIATGEAAGVARYHVIGFQNSDNVFGAAAVRTENGVSTVYASGVALPPPNDVRNCGACHDVSKGAKDAAEHANIVERRVCTGCHTDVWFNSATKPDPYHVLHVTNVGPLQFPSINDQSCAGCHAQRNAPANPPEFGRYVSAAHRIPSIDPSLPAASKQFAGLKFEILDLQNAGPGQKPTITFRVTNGDGSPVTDVSTFPFLQATIAGPTTDYSVTTFQQENLKDATATSTPGTYTKTFAGGPLLGATYSGTIPANATGTWAVGIEGRRSVTIVNSDEPAGAPGTIATTEGAFNPVRYFDPQGGTPAPRKLAVTQAQCNACHLDLHFHGNLRNNVEYCVMCHSPDNTDWSQRPKTGTGATATVNVAATADAKEERSIHFKPMLHRIHMGSGLQLQKPYVIYGFGGTPGFFDEGGLPDTARARCDKCHAGDAYKLESIPAGRQPTIANETATAIHTGSNAPVAGEPETLPMTSACISCHDTQQAVQHALSFQNQATRIERCLECHGDRGVRAVSRVHPIGGVAPTE